MTMDAPLHPSFRDGNTALCPYNDQTVRLFERWFADQQLVSLMGDWDFYPLPYYDLTPADYVKRTRKTTWLVCALSDGPPTPIGYTGLHLQPRHGVGILRLAIAEPEYRRLGHGTRATRMAITWAFDSLALHALHLSVSSSNHGAIALYRHCGFRECGRYRSARRERDGRYDDIHMELLADSR